MIAVVQRLLIYCLLGMKLLYGQELNCTVSVNSDFVNQTNQQIFKTLERQLKEFVNQTQWANRKAQQHELISCSMVFNITSYQGQDFTANLQIQSLRPVFHASYDTPVFNFQDSDVRFQYTEYQPLVFNPNSFDSNLVSIVTYYIYIILGLDADTLSPNGGDPYFEQAQRIVNNAQQKGFRGWDQGDGLRNRFWLVDNIRSKTFAEYRAVMYQYHREGLDIMYENSRLAKENIAQSLMLFQPLFNRRPNNFLIQIFFDAKSDEIEQIFSDGPSVNISNLSSLLNKIAPLFSSKWAKIKF